MNIPIQLLPKTGIAIFDRPLPELSEQEKDRIAFELQEAKDVGYRRKNSDS